MAISATSRGTTNTTTASGATAATVSGSFTPALGSTLVALISGYVGSVTSTADWTYTMSTSISGVGPWTLVGQIAGGTTFPVRLAVYTAQVVGTPSAGTVTVTPTSWPTVEYGLTLGVLELSDPAGAFIQAASVLATSSATVTATLNALSSGSGIAAAAFTSGNTVAGPVMPTGYTAMTTPVSNNGTWGNCGYHMSPSTTAVATTGNSTSGSNNYVLAVEFSPIRTPRRTAISQALQRVFLGRTTFKPHVAAPVQGAAAATLSVVGKRASGANQAIRAAQTARRGAPRPHVAAPIVAPGGPVVVVGSRGTVRASSVVARAVHYRVPPLRPHVASGISAPGGPVIAKRTMALQALQRALLGRTPPQPHVAKPIVAPGAPVVAAATIRLAKGLEQFVRRGAPKPHVAKPVVAPGAAVIASRTEVLSNNVELYARRGAPKPHVAPPNLSAQTFPPVAPGHVYSQAQNAGRRWWRDWDATLPLVKPIVAPGGPVVPGRTAVLQAMARPFVGRTVPKPHTASAIVAPGGPVIAGRTKILSNSTELFARRGAPKPHLAPVNLTPSTAAPVGFGSYIFTQARRRALLGRTIFKPHLVLPIVAPGGPVVAGRTEVLSTSGEQLVRRTVPKPHLAPSIVGAPIVPPVAAGVFIFQQARRRALLARTTPKPHLAGAAVAPGAAVVPGRTKAYQALARALAGRTIFAPHLARAIVAPGNPVIASITQRGQAITAALNARKPLTPKPHLAPPVVAPGQAYIAKLTIELQALRRMLVGRTVPSAHLAKPIVAPGLPVVPGRTEILSNSVELFVRRGAPKPHLAPPITPPVVLPPVARGTFIYPPGQSEATDRRGAPSPHVAKIIASPGRAVIPLATIRLQALAYARDVRRSLNPKPHLAPANLTPPPFPPAKIVGQALRALDRTTPGALRPAPRPHIARPLFSPGRAVVATSTVITTQSRRRALIHRTGPPLPHVTKPIVGPGFFYFVIGGTPGHVELGRLELARQGANPRWAARFAKVSDTGFSIIKEAGVYSQVQMPTPERINAAQVFYQGGFTYTVTEAEGALLTAAGYGSFLTHF